MALALGGFLSGALAQLDVIELGQRLKHADKEERRLAAYELQQLGAEAAPVVRQLTEALGDDDDQVWFRATMTLANIGPKASYAIPRLIEEMGGNNSRYAEQRSHRSAYALSKIGKSAVPALTTALQDDNEHRRWGAVHALGLMGDPAHGTLEAILPLLKDDEEAVRMETIETCVAFGSLAVAPVAAKLSSDLEWDRVGAATILRRVGDRAVSQRERLRAALINEDVPAVRGALLEAAVALQVDSEFLTPFATEALLGDEVEQDAAFQAVLASSSLSKEIVPKLSRNKATSESVRQNRNGRLSFKN